MENQASDRLAWINRWKKAKPLLDAQAKNELGEMSQEERQQQIANLLELADEFSVPRIDDGLVKLKIALTEMFGNE